MTEPIDLAERRLALRSELPGNYSFLTCACSPQFGAFMLVLVTHTATGSYICGLICSECEEMIDVSGGRPVRQEEAP